MKNSSLSVEQIKYIVSEIVGSLEFPEYQAQVYYMLMELNINYE